MITTTLAHANTLTRDAVTQQLEWDSEFDASAVGITERDGVVTLTGFIDTYAGKLAAERAAKRVRGVRVVANDIQVRLRLDRTDPEIAADVAAALMLRPAIPVSVQAVVHNGHVTLTGTAPTLFLSALAADAVRYLRGVKGTINHLQIVPAASVRDLRHRIVQAIHRSAEVDARTVSIAIDGSTVMLEGVVGSWVELEAAESAVMHAPGVTRVHNRISVEPQPVPLPLQADELP